MRQPWSQYRQSAAQLFLAALFSCGFLVGGCQARSNPELAKGGENERETAQSQAMSTRVPLNSMDLGAKTLGSLTWRGGLRLTSSNENFGGLSGLIISADGKEFLSVSDKGYWVSGTLVHEANKGAEDLIGADDIRIEPMLDPGGRSIVGKVQGDAESLVGDMDGDVLVSFEGNPRIWVYNFGRDGFKAKPLALALPPKIKEAKGNGGIEGLALLKNKPATILALTEDVLDRRGNMKGWLISPEGSSALSLKSKRPFKLTDLAVLPGGDVLTLERRFTLIGGVGFQIRRIDGATIKPGAILDGPVLANAGPPFTVDNMEGLDVWVDENGKKMLYILSDDNFSSLQRTLLVQFELGQP